MYQVEVLRSEAFEFGYAEKFGVDSLELCEYGGKKCLCVHLNGTCGKELDFAACLENLQNLGHAFEYNGAFGTFKFYVPFESVLGIDYTPDF